MSDKEILDKIKKYLDDKKKLKEMSNYALNWSKQYVTEKYNDILSDLEGYIDLFNQ